jgi:hypothetical protein
MKKIICAYKFITKSKLKEIKTKDINEKNKQEKPNEAYFKYCHNKFLFKQ